MKRFFLVVFINVFAGALLYSQCTIRGKVTDETGETVIGATVVLKSNKAIGVSTDLDGNYTLKLSDTTVQTLVVSFIGYNPIEAKVTPLKGKVVIKNFDLKVASNEMKEVEIVAKIVKSKDNYMDKVKANSATTLDFISSETMKKTGDASVVNAVARISGVSTNSGFITVRGIGDRYVKTTINGSRIPTLDPFTNNIKLDLFPASLVDNILITKTASPDLPGDWAGAYLSVETKDYPDKLSVNVESSFGYNNQSTFKDVISSKRSSTDWLGYDNSLRDHDHSSFTVARIGENSPSQYEELVALGLGDYYKSMGVTNNNWNNSDTYFKLGLVELGLLSKAEFDDPVAIGNAKSNYNSLYKPKAFNLINSPAAKSGQSFANNWNTKYRSAPLNFSQSFSIGNQVTLFGKPLGFIAGFRYGSSISYDPSASINRPFGVDINTKNDLSVKATEQASRESNGWSALFNLAYKLNANNSFSLLFMPNFVGTNNVRYTFDYISDDPNVYDLNKSLFYEQRKQLVYQYKSEHYIPSFKIKIEANASYTAGKSSTPDFKVVRFNQDIATGEYSLNLNGSDRAYRYLSEEILDTRLSAEMPIGNKSGLVRKLKIGGAYLNNDRNYGQYNYIARQGSGAILINSAGDLDEVFNLDRFGLYNNSLSLYYLRYPSLADFTTGFSRVTSGFAMMDYSIVTKLRFSGGLRIENATIYSDAVAFDTLKTPVPFGDERRAIFPINLNPANLTKTSFLPSANFIYKLKNDEFTPVNLRFNYSRTTARPSIRELSDAATFDYELRADVFGNSDLKMVRIDNYDLRLESYFKNGDNVSISLFYKDFRNHIELSEAFGSGGGSGYTWMNVDKSKVQGIELEGKKVLTKHFEFRSNIAFIKSSSTFFQNSLVITGGKKVYYPQGMVTRSMYGQAPYVINGILAYTADSLGLTATLSYNVQGPRLVIANAINKEFNVYEMPRHLLDFKVTKTISKHFNVSLTVRDIFNAPIRRSYNYSEGFVLDYDKYRYGTNFLLAISYKL